MLHLDTWTGILQSNTRLDDLDLLNHDKGIKFMYVGELRASS
jgi:hypothetical protein